MTEPSETPKRDFPYFPRDAPFWATPGWAMILAAAFAALALVSWLAG